MIDLALTIAGIGWDNEIRGALTVVVGSAVLMGSVWLLLATNTGIRLGSLIAFAGFFGWMFLMGLVWWLYGIGFVGSTPTWVFEELALDDEIAADIRVDDVEQIVSTDGQPQAIVLVRQFGDEALRNELDSVDVDAITVRLTDANNALPDSDPRKLDEAALSDAIDEAISDAGRRNEQLSLTQLAAVSPEVIAEATEAGLIRTGDWRLVDAAEAGEAQTAATAALLEEGTFTSSGEYVFVNVFQQGGKPGRADNSIWNRFTNRIDRLVTITHPTNHVVVQVQKALVKETPLGGTPAFTEVDPSEPVINVVLVRDIGDRRLRPALVTIVSFLFFVAAVLMLHLRDRNFAATEEAYAIAGA
jgi:hypothetical protein